MNKDKSPIEDWLFVALKPMHLIIILRQLAGFKATPKIEREAKLAETIIQGAISSCRLSDDTSSDA